MAGLVACVGGISYRHVLHGGHGVDSALRRGVGYCGVGYGSRPAPKGAADYFSARCSSCRRACEIGSPVPGTVHRPRVVWVVIFLVVFKGTQVIGPVSQWVMIIAWAFLSSWSYGESLSLEHLKG